MTDISVTVGDVIHFVEDGAVAVAIDPAIAIQAVPSVSELLSQSRQAHAAFRVASGHINRDGTIQTHPDDPAAATAIRTALDARLQAEASDTAHSDPAWAEDQAENRGISSAAMIDFFRDYLS